jgi:hypothetical protein
LLGSASIQGEYSFGGKHSLTGKIGLPVSTRRSFTYEEQDAVFNMKATSFLAGYRTYLSKKHLAGFYLEPYFKYVHHSSEGEGSGMIENRTAIFNFTNDYNGTGIGVQLGAQFLVKKRFVIDLFFLGPEINSSQNIFKAVEKTRTIPWSSVQASEAENDIRNFLEQFPFIRNKTTVMVDKENHSVSAQFKGALPGIRTGISFGFAF